MASAAEAEKSCAEIHNIKFCNKINSNYNKAANAVFRELRCLLIKNIMYCLVNTNMCIQECKTKDNDLVP
jgi:hypothetical protein